jgi:hypothetical protein
VGINEASSFRVEWRIPLRVGAKGWVQALISLSQARSQTRRNGLGWVLKQFCTGYIYFIPNKYQQILNSLLTQENHWKIFIDKSE